jgi:hypothetical protein
MQNDFPLQRDNLLLYMRDAIRCEQSLHARDSYTGAGVGVPCL